MSFDGTWSFIIHYQKRGGGFGKAGGVLIARGGRVAGGTSDFVFTGTAREDGNTVEAAISLDRFNWDPPGKTVWGDDAARMDLRVSGQIEGDKLVGRISRDGPELDALDITMKRHAAAP